ncbi:aldo/keto reductase [Candidatus Pelagibacter sp.]|nr:aldo/keto reductase [Candidatus Pelagibacter sp.]
MHKIVIGTANFNQRYGLSNFKFKKKEIKNKIIKTIKRSKIKYIDTAFDYNLSTNFIQSANIKKFNIITKIKIPKRNTIKFFKNIRMQILKKIKAFEIKKLEAVLFHETKDLNHSNGFKLLKILQDLKKEGKIKKIGVSLYTSNDLKIVLKIFKPDIVQLPLNVFNQNLIRSKYFKIIKKRKISIQVRSIFLQGLLLKNIDKLKKLKLNKMLFLNLINFDKWCIRNKISRIEACVYFIKNIKGINLITIGFNNQKEFNEILKALKKNKKLNFRRFNLNSVITDPRKWSIKKKI